jgi:hypothetical protein
MSASSTPITINYHIHKKVHAATYETCNISTHAQLSASASGIKRMHNLLFQKINATERTGHMNCQYRGL